jgi:hypothetical protein
MNKRRIIFLSFFGAYHLIVSLFTLYIESQKKDFSVLLGLFDMISLFKYGAFLGLVLLITEFVWVWREAKSNALEKEAQRLENNTLKAKVYDMTEAAKVGAQTQPAK